MIFIISLKNFLSKNLTKIRGHFSNLPKIVVVSLTGFQKGRIISFHKNQLG